MYLMLSWKKSVSCSNRHHEDVAVEAQPLYYPALGHSKKAWQWLRRMSSMHCGASEQNWLECYINLSNSLRSSAPIWRMSMPLCGCSIQISGQRTSVPSSRESVMPGFVRGSVCG